MILNVNLNANNKTFFLVSSKTLIVEVHKSKTHIFSPKKKSKTHTNDVKILYWQNKWH